MMDNDFDPYETLIKACESIVMLEELCNQLVEANNNQARLVEDMSKGYRQLADIAYENSRYAAELNTTIKHMHQRIQQLEQRNR